MVARASSSMVSSVQGKAVRKDSGCFLRVRGASSYFPNSRFTMFHLSRHVLASSDRPSASAVSCVRRVISSALLAACTRSRSACSWGLAFASAAFRASERHGALLAGIKKHDAAAWSQSFLEYLKRVRSTDDPSSWPSPESVGLPLEQM